MAGISAGGTSARRKVQPLECPKVYPLAPTMAAIDATSEVASIAALVGVKGDPEESPFPPTRAAINATSEVALIAGLVGRKGDPLGKVP